LPFQANLSFNCEENGDKIKTTIEVAILIIIAVLFNL
jgi:hypothetical protein